jgi:hypothetical protein
VPSAAAGWPAVTLDGVAGTLTRSPAPSSPAPAVGPARWWRHAPAPAALAGWVALIWLAHHWGRHLLDTEHQLQVGFPPLVGRLDPRLGVAAAPAVVLAGTAVLAAPALAARLPWRRLLVATALAAAAWAVALALVDGPGALTRPLVLRGEYLHDVARVGSPTRFLASFTDRLPTYHTHTQGHPPGLVILLSALDRAGLGGPGWMAALCIAAGASAAPAALIALRSAGGETAARRAAPFLAFAPAAVWVATTADAFYAGLGAWGVALLALAFVAAGDGPARHRSDLLAAAGGLLLGGAAYFSYGLVLLAPVVAGLTLASRTAPAPWRPLGVAALAAGAVAIAFTVAGFWWFEGLAATRAAYFTGVASRRPYGYFLLANLAAFAVAVGPAAAVALARLRSSGPWLLAGGALVAVVLADGSGLSKGEVERIWLPFVPWVLVATPALRARGWLGLQVATGLAVQMTVRTPW